MAPGPGIVYSLSGAGNFSTLVTAHTADGTTLWEAGQIGLIPGSDMAVDPDDGTVYVAGTSSSFEATVLAYARGGRELWRTRFPGLVATVFLSPDSEKPYVIGETARSAQLPHTDVLVGAYTPRGRLLWTTTYDGPAGLDEHAPAAAVDAGTGTVYVTAESMEPSIAIDDWATLAVTPDGQLDWVTGYDGGRDDKPTAVVVDPKRGRVIVGGRARGSVFVLTYTSAGALVDTDRFGTGGSRFGRLVQRYNTVEDLVIDPHTGARYLAATMNGYGAHTLPVSTTIAYSP